MIFKKVITYFIFLLLAIMKTTYMQHQDWECIVPWIFYNSDRNFVRYRDTLIHLSGKTNSEILAFIFLNNRKIELNIETIISHMEKYGVSIKEKVKHSSRYGKADILKDYMNNFKNSPLFFIYNEINIKTSPELIYILDL